MSVLFLLISAPFARVQSQEEERIAALLRERATGIEISSYARLIASAVPPELSPERRERLLRALPSALDYHLEAVGFPRRMGVDLPEDFLREGYDIELEYLTARIRRWCRRVETPDERAAVVEQIHTLANALRDALREKFPGEAARPLVDREADRVRRAWLDSLEKPLKEFIDRPLSPTDLEEILGLLRRKASEGGPIVLTPDDVADQETLGGKGARGAMAALRDTAYLAMARCYSEHALLSARCKDWFQRCQLRVDVALRSPRDDSESPKNPSASPQVPSEHTRREEEEPRTDRQPVSPPPPSGSTHPAPLQQRPVWLWILLALGISFVMFLRSRRAS